MKNQHPQEGWYRQSENRRPRERYQHSSNSGRSFRDQHPEAYERPARYSGPGQQGRKPDLHGSHPYDYSLPPETNRHMGPGYYPPPAYRKNPAWDQAPEKRYDYPAPYQHRPEQNHWSGNRQPSYEERQDYIRARDRHTYDRQPRENQNRYRPQHREEFRQDNHFPPHYPDRGGNQYGRARDHDQEQGWPEKLQQNRKPYPQHRTYHDRPGDDYRY